MPFIHKKCLHWEHYSTLKVLKGDSDILTSSPIIIATQKGMYSTEYQTNIIVKTDSAHQAYTSLSIKEEQINSILYQLTDSSNIYSTCKYIYTSKLS
jgi:hypothetical protein